MQSFKLHLVLAALGLANAQSLTSTAYFPVAATRIHESAATTLPLLKNASYPFLGTVANKTTGSANYKNHCIVEPLGWGQDDSSQILAAVEHCGKDGIITLPASYVYTISRRMSLHLKNAKLEIHGALALNPDIRYWVQNSHRVEFQNQSTAIIISGHNFKISGDGWARGGINGNGQAWMTQAAGHSNHSHVELSDIYIDGTNTDPSAGISHNYGTNLDGLNTFRIDHLTARNWLFHGGDDCLSLKSNSSNIHFQHITCVGGGIAFGSLGQYASSPDYVSNVTVLNVTVSRDNRPNFGGANLTGAVVFKSCAGVAMGVAPQGGGSGTGKVSNITFDGLRAEGVQRAVYVNKCYFKVPEQAAYCDTSTFEFADLWFHNVTGSVTEQESVLLNCSAAAPCRGIQFDDVEVYGSGGKGLPLTCVNVEGVTGAVCNSTMS